MRPPPNAAQGVQTTAGGERCRTRGTCRWRRSDTFCRFVSDPLAEHRTAADGCAPVRQPQSYILVSQQNVTIKLRSRNSKALEQDMYRKSAALAQANERVAALASGRLHGCASDGAELTGHHINACKLASPPTRPSHVCTPPAPVRAFADSRTLNLADRFVARVPQVPRSSRGRVVPTSYIGRRWRAGA